MNSILIHVKYPPNNMTLLLFFLYTMSTSKYYVISFPHISRKRNISDGSKNRFWYFRFRVRILFFGVTFVCCPSVLYSPNSSTCYSKILACGAYLYHLSGQNTLTLWPEQSSYKMDELMIFVCVLFWRLWEFYKTNQ